MNINIGVRWHNKFEIEVRDTISNKIVEERFAENIVLNACFNDTLVGGNANSYIMNSIEYGTGTGVLSPTRTTLFTKLGAKAAIKVKFEVDVESLTAYRKAKIVILPEEHIGVTLTEVGLKMGYNPTYGTIGTHALIKDSEGNILPIGPKTDTQEITIYATVYGAVTLEDGIDLLHISNEKPNWLLSNLVGEISMGYIDDGTGGIYYSSNKEPTQTDKRYDNLEILYKGAALGYGIKDKPARKRSSTRRRLSSTQGAGKIWSIAVAQSWISNSYPAPALFRMVFPSPIWPGYEFEGKSIGVGDGIKTKFVLPWSDINDSKAYKFYKDGVLQIEGTDYTLANSESETSITFVTAPADELPITGDWWVDYIPKDETNILDLTSTIIFNEGV